MLRLAVLASAALLAATGAQAQEPAVPPTGESAAATTAPAAKAKGDKVVCKSLSSTGSRLGGSKVCRPQKEWEEIRQASKDEVDRKQRMRQGSPSN